RETDHLGPPSGDSGESTPGAHRTHSWMVVGDLRIVVHQHLVELYDVGFAFAELIAGAVTANHDILRHKITRNAFSKLQSSCFAGRGLYQVPVGLRSCGRNRCSGFSALVWGCQWRTQPVTKLGKTNGVLNRAIL